MAQAQQKTSPLSNADFRMQSDDLLLYPEATAISFAFKQNLMNYFLLVLFHYYYLHTS